MNIFKWFRRVYERLDKIISLLKEIILLLEEISRLLSRSTSTKLVVKLEGGKTGMTNTVQEGLLIGASDTEFNAEGEQIPAADLTKLTYAVDDPTVALVVTPAEDPTIPVGQVRIKGLKVGTVNVTSTDNAFTPPLVSEPVLLTVTFDPVATKLVVALA